MEIKFLNGPLNNNQQQTVTSGFLRHSRGLSAPAFQKERVNWLVYEGDNTLIGALTADVLWDWIYIEELWVDETCRGGGIGKLLMEKAEEYVISQDMTGLWLWTQSWQAPEFYTRLGYSEFTRFDDFPRGYQRIGFRKQVAGK